MPDDPCNSAYSIADPHGGSIDLTCELDDHPDSQDHYDIFYQLYWRKQ